MVYQKPPVRAEYQRTHVSRLSLSEQKKLLEQANQKDIFAVAQSLGMKVNTRSGKAEWEGHTSLVLDRKKNYFYWNGQSLAGNPVDLVSIVQQGARTREDLKKSLKQSIAYLTNTPIAQFDVSKVPKQVPFSYPLRDLPKLNEARQYLKNERGFSDETIDFFEEKGVIAESTWQNRFQDTPNFEEPVLVFKHYNAQGEVTGATLQGIRYNEVHVKKCQWTSEAYYPELGVL